MGVRLCGKGWVSQEQSSAFICFCYIASVVARKHIKLVPTY